MLQAINDALWLHYPHFYLADGVPVEGVSYTYLTLDNTATIAALHREAFGLVPAAISAASQEGVVRYLLASLSGEARMVDLGDSNLLSGIKSVATLAVAARRLLTDESDAPLALDASSSRRVACAAPG